MISASEEVESIKASVARHFDVYGIVVTPLALTFQVHLPPTGFDAPFDGLRQELVPRDYIPTITQDKGETLVHVQRRPKARFARLQVNVALLFLTVLTTVFFGGAWNWADYSGMPILSAVSIGYGTLFFSLPLLAILGCHEMGHYLVARRYKVHASLPFFLPSAPPLGTLGAFISMRDPIPNRRALLDIGVSGPLVGFAVAIPVTLAGLALAAASPPAPSSVAGDPQPSLLFSFLSLFFPLGPYPRHPLAFAGWVGLFVTAINLLPAGQLDGGHVARALLGRKQFYLSWAAVLVLFGLSAFYPGWFLFGFLVLILGVRHPPPLNDLTKLDSTRKLIGIAAVAILVITFVPQPFSPGSNPRAFQFESGGMQISDISGDIRLGTTFVVMFEVNNTGRVRFELVLTTVDRSTANLESYGFTILFASYRIGSNTTTANNETVSLSLSSGQLAFVQVNVTAPTAWGEPNLPQQVSFPVYATTRDGAVRGDLQVNLRVTA